MHLSRVKLWNFRRYGAEGQLDLENPHLNVAFKPGLNVLVGENDTGKSAIIDAIRLVLGTHSIEWNHIVSEDFFRESLRLRIELVFEQLSDDEAKNFVEWLVWRREGEAVSAQLRLIYDVRRTTERVLPCEVRAGADSEGSVLYAEARDYLRCTYLRPLRDAQTDLIPKRNSRVAQIFLSHEAFKGKDTTHYLVNHFRELNRTIEGYFLGNNADGSPLEEDLEGKHLKDEIDKYVRAFRSSETTTEISVVEANLKAILEKLELSVGGEVNPGLGTLNRLYMAAELIHLNKKNWQGLRLGLIEELEAHLHPQAQMQIVEELQKQTAIQLILTTHSPNLTSKVKLENLIICNGNQAFPMGSTYTSLDEEQYKYLELFLDVTKANLFFAKGVILVEGWAEELLIPALASEMKALGLIPNNLTEAGVSIINVAGKGFLQYSRIFLRHTGPIMSTRVAIVIDNDVREYEQDPADGYVLRNPELVRQEQADVGAAKTERFNSENIKVFLAPRWTLEYSLLHSMALRDYFVRILKLVHPHVDEAHVEKELARKLMNNGLKKTELAFRMATLLEEDSKQETHGLVMRMDDPGIAYLMEAIKYAAGH
jgi:putative ATP-dependent endonuclease of the OLD family